MAESVQPFDLEGIYASAFIVTLGHLIKLSLVPDMQEYVALYIHTVLCNIKVYSTNQTREDSLAQLAFNGENWEGLTGGTVHRLVGYTIRYNVMTGVIFQLQLEDCMISVEADSFNVDHSQNRQSGRAICIHERYLMICPR